MTRYRTSVERNAIGEYPLVLPQKLEQSAVSYARIDRLYAPDPTDLICAHRIRLECAATPDGYDLLHAIRPALSNRHVRDLPMPATHRFWEYQGWLRHIGTPCDLLDWTRALNFRALQPHARLYHTSGEDPPFRVYQPRGPWEFLFPRDAYDLAHHARLRIPASATRGKLLPDLLDPLLRTYANSEYHVLIEYASLQRERSTEPPSETPLETITSVSTAG